MIGVFFSFLGRLARWRELSCLSFYIVYFFLFMGGKVEKKIDLYFGCDIIHWGPNWRCGWNYSELRKTLMWIARAHGKVENARGNTWKQPCQFWCHMGAQVAL
jgi:hypothetical protein